MEIRLKAVWGLQSLDCKIRNFKNLHRLVLKLLQSQDFQKPWPLGRGHCDSNSRFLVDTPTVSNWNVTSFSSFTSPGVHARPAGGRQYPDIFYGWGVKSEQARMYYLQLEGTIWGRPPTLINVSVYTSVKHINPTVWHASCWCWSGTDILILPSDTELSTWVLGAIWSVQCHSIPATGLVSQALNVTPRLS